MMDAIVSTFVIECKGELAEKVYYFAVGDELVLKVRFARVLVKGKSLAQGVLTPGVADTPSAPVRGAKIANFGSG